MSSSQKSCNSRDARGCQCIALRATLTLSGPLAEKQSGAEQTHTHTKTQAKTTEQRERRSQEAAKDRMRKSTQDQKGHSSAQAESQRGPGSYSDEYLSEGVQSTQQHMQRGVEGQFPTHGHRPLLPRDTRRGKTKHDDTPSTMARQPSRRQEQQILGGRHQYQPGPGSPEGTGGAPLWESKFYAPFQPQKRACNKSNNLICRPELTFIRLKNTSVYTVDI